MVGSNGADTAPAVSLPNTDTTTGVLYGVVSESSVATGTTGVTVIVIVEVAV